MALGNHLNNNVFNGIAGKLTDCIYASFLMI
ncbi:hypothetical protein SAMN06265377_1127 [Flagellimonas pacifica]|uniref:Uncharacterized protein n=1 Tax=Flagellimonas pacifica TaxID=1247520 RepID=A0A285MEC1_9FLAO|nr:hypothetical protein SAMN06265377_1127 [Allomuricauda parva]